MIADCSGEHKMGNFCGIDCLIALMESLARKLEKDSVTPNECKSGRPNGLLTFGIRIRNIQLFGATVCLI